MKRWVKIVLAVVVVLVLAIAAIPLFVNTKTLTPVVEKQLTTALGRNVTISRLSLSVLSGGLVAEDVSIADDPAFETAPFLRAKELRIRVEPAPLLFSHEVHVTQLEIEAPDITLIQTAKGTWNFSSMGGTMPPAGASLPNLASLSVGRVGIEGARITITSLPPQGAPSIYENVYLTARDFSLSTKFPFELTADLPADGKLSAAGHAGPLTPGGGAAVLAPPFDADITLRHFDPARSGFMDTSSDVVFLADADAHVGFDGQSLAAKGTAQLTNVKLHKGAPAAPGPIDLAFDSTHGLGDGNGRVQDVSLTVGRATVHAAGTYQVTPATATNPALNLKITGRNLPIDDLQPVMAAAAVRLPNGSRLNGGTLSFDLTMTGTPKSSTVVGPVALDNTQLVGFDIGSKIHGIAALAGVKTGNTSTFEKLSMDLKVTNAGVVVDGLSGSVVGLGPFTGSGTIAANDQLDFHLLVQVAGAKGIAKIGASLLAKLNGTGGSGSGSGVPMHVTGPSDNPSITAEVGAGGSGKKKPSLK